MNNAAQPRPRPNILVVMTDDHGQWATGCYGNRELHTPTLDYLAHTGTRFANAFTPTPVCSPARASFFTGRLPSQHGIHDYLAERMPEVGERDWLADETTLPQLLSAAGYQTALSGKWHCGRGAHPQPGFDTWFSLGPAQGNHIGPHTYYDGSTPVTIRGYKAEITTDHALRFLDTRDDTRPFFLFVGYIATHSPWAGHPERLVARYRDCTFDDIPADTAYPFGRRAGEGAKLLTDAAQRAAKAEYYAAVSVVDEQVGRLLDALDAAGTRDNTLVVYTADHGLNCGQHGVWGKGNGTRPLNMLEESIRVPLILNQPDLFAGQVRAEFVDHCDLFSTLCDIGGVEISEADADTRRYPGRSFAPVLSGGVITDRDAVFGEYGNLRMIRTRVHKLIQRYPDGPCELFDLTVDPRETVNLFNDAAYQVYVQQLTARLDAHFARYQDPVKSGLNVRTLPVHNPVEAWREGGD